MENENENMREVDAKSDSNIPGWEVNLSVSRVSSAGI